jgi:hypothetical protein
MELENTPRRFAILPLCLAAVLSAFGCGDDPEPTDEGTKSPSTADDASSKTPAKADAGATPTNPTPSDPQSTGNKPDAAASKPDVGAGKDAGAEKPDPGSAKPSGASGNTIYTGAPECPKYGRKIAGTVEGMPVSYNLAAVSEFNETSFEAEESGVDSGNIELEWEAQLAPGKTAMITSGVLRLPSMYAFGPYCVVAGVVQDDATLAGTNDIQRFFKITKVKKQVKQQCEGPELEADLKVCARN